MMNAIRTFTAFLLVGSISSAAVASDYRCSTLAVDVNSSQVEAVRKAMVDADSPAGVQLWGKLSKGHWRLDRAGRKGKSPLDRIADASTATDVCFDKSCGDLPRQGPVILYSCYHRSCMNKSAALATPSGKLMAVASTDEAPSGTDLKIYLERSKPAQSTAVRMLAAWAALELRYVKYAPTGNGPDWAKLQDFRSIRTKALVCA